MLAAPRAPLVLSWLQGKVLVSQRPHLPVQEAPAVISPHCTLHQSWTSSLSSSSHHGHNYDHRGHYQHHQPALINECWHNFGPKLRAKIKAQIMNGQKVYKCHITIVPGPWSRGPTYPPPPWESWPGRWGPQPGGRDTEKLGNRGFFRWSILSVSYQYVGWHLLMLRRRVQPSCY